MNRDPSTEASGRSGNPGGQPEFFDALAKPSLIEGGRGDANRFHPLAVVAAGYAVTWVSAVLLCVNRLLGRGEYGVGYYLIYVLAQTFIALGWWNWSYAMPAGDSRAALTKPFRRLGIGFALATVVVSIQFVRATSDSLSTLVVISWVCDLVGGVLIAVGFAAWGFRPRTAYA